MFIFAQKAFSPAFLRKCQVWVLLEFASSLLGYSKECACKAGIPTTLAFPIIFADASCLASVAAVFDVSGRRSATWAEKDYLSQAFLGLMIVDNMLAWWVHTSRSSMSVKVCSVISIRVSGGSRKTRCFACRYYLVDLITCIMTGGNEPVQKRLDPDMILVMYPCFTRTARRAHAWRMHSIVRV
jgi:hypothetical protein